MRTSSELLHIFQSIKVKAQRGWYPTFLGGSSCRWIDSTEQFKAPLAFMKLGDLVGPVVGSSKSFNLWCDGLRAAVCFQSYGLPMFFAAGFVFLCFHRASPVVNSRPQSFPSFLQVGQLLEVFIGVELKGFTPADFQPFKKVFCSDIVVFKKRSTSQQAQTTRNPLCFASKQSAPNIHLCLMETFHDLIQRKFAGEVVR